MVGFRTQSFQNLQKLFNEFDRIIREMEVANYFLPKTEKIHYFLESIPTEFSQLVANFEFLDDESFNNLSFSEMKSKFFNVELKQKVQNGTSSTSAVFVAKQNGRKRFRCYTCGAYGHKSYQCQKNQQSYDRNRKSGNYKRQKSLQNVQKVLSHLLFFSFFIEC